MAVSDAMVEAALDAERETWRMGTEGQQRSDRARMRRALEAAEAVRGGDAAPPAGTVAVRVAVALSEKNHIPWVEVVFSDDEEAFQACERMGHYIRSCIATIHAPLPAVAEVGAVVEGA